MSYMPYGTGSTQPCPYGPIVPVLSVPYPTVLHFPTPVPWAYGLVFPLHYKTRPPSQKPAVEKFLTVICGGMECKRNGGTED